MNRNDKTPKAQEVVGKLMELGIRATLDGCGRVMRPFASQEEDGNICLPPEEMEKLVDQACVIGLRNLPAGILEDIFITLYNTNYVYCRQ